MREERVGQHRNGREENQEQLVEEQSRRSKGYFIPARSKITQNKKKWHTLVCSVCSNIFDFISL